MNPFQLFGRRSRDVLRERLDRVACEQQFALLDVASKPLFRFLEACGESFPRPDGHLAVCDAFHQDNDGGPYILKTVYCKEFGLSGSVKYEAEARSIRAEFFMFSPSCPEDANLERVIIEGACRSYDPVGRPYEHVPVALGILGYWWPELGAPLVRHLKEADLRQGTFAEQVWGNVVELDRDLWRIKVAARRALGRNPSTLDR